jgi:hypothetical protein
MSVPEMLVDKMSVHKMFVPKMLVHETSVEKMTDFTQDVCRQNVDKVHI